MNAFQRSLDRFNPATDDEPYIDDRTVEQIKSDDRWFLFWTGLSTLLVLALLTAWWWVPALVGRAR